MFNHVSRETRIDMFAEKIRNMFERIILIKLFIKADHTSTVKTGLELWLIRTVRKMDRYEFLKSVKPSTKILIKGIYPLH